MLLFFFLVFSGFAPGWSFESHYIFSLVVCRFISRLEDGLIIHDYTLILFFH